MTKQRAVELHLIENGSITSWEAIEEYGASRLAAIINVLRDRGWSIETENIQFTDRFGKPGHCAKYHLREVGVQSGT